MKKIILLLSFVGFLTCGFSQIDKPLDNENRDDKNQSETIILSEFREPEMPQFPGGEVALFKFVQDNFKYPQSAIENEIKGTVYVSFVVEVDGTLSGIKIIRSLNTDCDAEAIRLVTLFPKWIPGKQNGKPISMQIAMPVKFILKED